MKQKEENFEEALKKLEAIVDDLESGELSLNEAIKRYEEGMALSQFCTKRLHDIQKKIEVLVKDPSGKISTKEFGAPQTGKRTGKKAEELLF